MERICRKGGIFFGAATAVSIVVLLPATDESMPLCTGCGLVFYGVLLNDQSTDFHNALYYLSDRSQRALYIGSLGDNCAGRWTIESSAAESALVMGDKPIDKISRCLSNGIIDELVGEWAEFHIPVDT